MLNEVKRDDLFCEYYAKWIILGLFQEHFAGCLVFLRIFVYTVLC